MADFSVVAKLMADSSAFTKGVGEAKSAIETLPKSTSQADRKSTRLNSSHRIQSRMPSSA